MRTADLALSVLPAPRETWPAAGDVHLWSADLGAARSEIGLLDADERRRATRFQDQIAGARFVASRCVLRRVLASYLGVAPEAVGIRRDPSERPVLMGAGGLHFSLSRSDDVFMLALASDSVGVDVEPRDASADMERLIDAVMTEGERAALGESDPETCSRLSHELWSNKEAVLKALGVGFTADPRQVEVGWGEGCRRIALPGSARTNIDLRRFAFGEVGGAVALCAPIGEVIRRCW